MKLHKALFFAALACSFVACKKDPTTTTGGGGKADFDRKSLLTNLGNNIILPSYQALQNSENTLDSAITAFNAAPDAAGLSGMQNSFKNTYRAWQLCSPFELGVADQITFNLNTNTFPTDATTINNNIAAGSYNLNIFANNAAKGLPAIDYLLFGSDNTTLLSLYTTDSKASNRKQYLAAVSAAIKADVDKVVKSWSPSGDNYINTFINADGTDAGSSVGLLINKMDYDCEVLKNYKLGIPLGAQSMGNAFPNVTEAYYSGISAQLALLQLQAIQNIYLGKSAQGDGIGFDDYLVQLNAQYHGGSLNDTIKNQFTVAISKLQMVADPLSATIQSNPSQVNAAYVAVQRIVVLLKTDMPSAMGVLITYSDSDGD